jgi:hypothetical protein
LTIQRETISNLPTGFAITFARYAQFNNFTKTTPQMREIVRVRVRVRVRNKNEVRWIKYLVPSLIGSAAW